MPGLNNFGGAAAAATTPTPTTYSATYATTAQDAKDKCEGNAVASVSRTATSTVSFVDALTKATTAAKAAIVCPVFTGSYTTTPADYETKCGNGTSGASVTRTATSGKDQATADAAAKAAAIAAITCPLPPKNYGLVLSSSQPEGGSVSFSTSNGHKISFDAIAGASGSPFDAVFSWNGQNSFATLPAEYQNKPFAFFDATGAQHDITSGGTQAYFISGTINF